MERTALLVVDMQNRFLDMAIAGGIVDKVVSLVKAFKDAGGVVVFTQHHCVPGSSSKLLDWWKNPIIKGSHDWELIDELKPFADEQQTSGNGEVVVIDDKTRYDAFLGTRLDDELKARGVGAVVVVGCMTNLCCETTARGAFMRDYDVTFVSDANATDASLREIPGLAAAAAAATTADMQAASILNLGYGFAAIKTFEETEKAIADAGAELSGGKC